MSQNVAGWLVLLRARASIAIARISYTVILSVRPSVCPSRPGTGWDRDFRFSPYDSL